MTRIIAGTARGRRLVVPKSGTRPTSDRVRESVFSSLGHSIGGFAGCYVLDLFAGSGALGLESVSRGAQAATLVDSAKLAITACRTNIANTGLAAEVVQANVVTFTGSRPARPFDVVFIDPPYEYASFDVNSLLVRLSQLDWLAQDSTVVVERGRGSAALEWPLGFHDISARSFGDTVVTSANWRHSDDGW